MQRHANIVNISELDWEVGGNGDRFVYQHKSLTPLVGAKMLGCSLYRVVTGQTAFPRHRHHANDEAIYILEGRGRLRLDDEEYEVGAGDYIALPVGGPAHQLIGGDGDDLVYLCLSTMVHPDVTEYPDSGKVGVFSGSAPGGDKSARSISAIFRQDSEVDYYDGE